MSNDKSDTVHCTAKLCKVAHQALLDEVHKRANQQVTEPAAHHLIAMLYRNLAYNRPSFSVGFIGFVPGCFGYTSLLLTPL
jgi:hypothetical protein